MAKKVNTEGNLYDKIFKENAESIFIPLVEEQLGIKIKKFTPLKEKIQTTVEREMDFLYEAIIEEDKKIILHLEFQSVNDPEMLFRMAEYHGMVLRRYRLPVYHVVIYLGLPPFSMRSALKPEEVFSSFNLINVNSLDVSRLLSSQIPEVIILAVLGNYPIEQSESILRLLVRNLKTACKRPAELSKYLKQLIILSRLRKLGELTIKIATEMPINYDIETDFLYQQGVEKGIEKGIEKGLEKGIEKGMEKGMEKERHKARLEKIETAKKMLLAGLTEGQVADFLALPLEEIIVLKENLDNQRYN